MTTYRQHPDLTQTLQQRLLAEFRDYVQSRRNDVARGAETPELAALIAEKYGYGLAKAAQLLDFDSGSLMAEVDRLLAEIDPDIVANRKKRWAARPAGLLLGVTAES